MLVFYDFFFICPVETTSFPGSLILPLPPGGGKIRDVAVEIDDPTFRAFIHLIHVTGPLCGLFLKQPLNYKPVELDFALHKVRSIFIAITGT